MYCIGIRCVALGFGVFCLGFGIFRIDMGCPSAFDVLVYNFLLFRIRIKSPQLVAYTTLSQWSTASICFGDDRYGDHRFL
jgi:hypothetical protein